MTRIESELHDLYEYLMRNDDMADRDTYHTIVGIANDVAEVETENDKLRKLVRDMHGELVSCEDNGYVCGGHKFDKRVRETGIEVIEE